MEELTLEDYRQAGKGLAIFVQFLVVYCYIGNTVLTSHIAGKKGHDWITWLFVGFAVPWISLLAAVGLPDRGIRRDVQAGFQDLTVNGIDTRPTQYPPRSDLPRVP